MLILVFRLLDDADLKSKNSFALIVMLYIALS